MATDAALPNILATAAGRVDRVAEQLLTVARVTQTVAVRALLGWSGPSAGKYSAYYVKVSQELLVETRMARELADILRRAAKSASERLYWEAKAAEAARQAEAARVKAAAAKAQAQARRGMSR